MALQGLLASLSDMRDQVGQNRFHVERLQKDVQSLEEIVMEGNGKSLVERVAVLEREVTYHEASRGNRWMVIVALASGLMALIGSIYLASQHH